MTINIIKQTHQSNNMNFGHKTDIDFEDILCDFCGKECGTVWNISMTQKTVKAYYAKCYKCDKEFWFDS
jgi:hypothetical protein